jgi:ABC-2 type transport system permease protein
MSRMRPLLVLTRANILSFVRDRTALFWTLAFPVIFILLFGAIFSGGGNTTYRVGWVDEDGTPASAALREAFAGVPLLELQDDTLDASREAMQSGNLQGIIVVPQGLGAATRAAATSGGASGGAGAEGKPAIAIELYTDPSQQTSSTTIQQVVSQVVATANVALTGSSPMLGVDSRTLQTQDLTAAAFLVPGILGMALMQLGVFGAVPLVAQREKLILKRLGATPLPRWTLVGSNVILRLLIGLVQAVLIVGIGIAVFGVQILGSLLAMLGLVVLGALTFIAIGYVVAAFARTEEAANGIVQVIQFPMMFLSGVFFPLELMPALLKPVAVILPLTYLGDALRQVMVDGTPLAPLPVDVLVLTGWFVVCLFIAARYFRWE